MACSETVQNIYTNYSNSLINNSINRVTTIYEFGLFDNAGLNLLNVRLYSRFIPNDNNLEEHLIDESDLRTGLYKAIQSMSESIHKSGLKEFVSEDGRVTRFHKINVNNEDYFLTLTYDRDVKSYSETESLINDLLNEADLIINSDESIIKFQQTGLVDLDSLSIKLIRLLNIGYNNDEAINYIESLKNKFINQCKQATFFNKDELIIAEDGLRKLRILHELFPNIDIDIESLEQLLSNNYQRIKNRDEELRSVNEFRKSFINYVDNIINLISDSSQTNVMKASTELMFPKVLDGVNNERVNRLRNKLRSKAKYLQELRGDDLLINIELINTKEWLELIKKEAMQINNY